MRFVQTGLCFAPRWPEIRLHRDAINRFFQLKFYQRFMTACGDSYQRTMIPNSMIMFGNAYQTSCHTEIAFECSANVGAQKGSKLC